VGVGLLALILAGCAAEATTSVSDEADLSEAFSLAAGWLGDYFGTGNGLVDGQPFEVRDAVLRIAFDVDAVALPSCPACVTVSLDSVFVLVNIRVPDPVEMALTYDRGVVRHTLALTRFSAAGGLGNAISARATIGTAGVATPFFDVTYALERP